MRLVELAEHVLKSKKCHIICQILEMIIKEIRDQREWSRLIWLHKIKADLEEMFTPIEDNNKLEKTAMPALRGACFL